MKACHGLAAYEKVTRALAEQSTSSLPSWKQRASVSPAKDSGCLRNFELGVGDPRLG